MLRQHLASRPAFRLSSRLPSRVRCCVLFAFSLVLLVGCDSEGDDEKNGGGKQFSATISGSRTGSYSGSAFSVETHDPPISWGVILTDPDQSGFQILIAREGKNPSPGSYPIVGDPTSTQAEAIVNITGLLDLYHAISGTLNVTSSSATHIVATFSFTAEYSGLDTALMDTEITVTGSFDTNVIIDDGSNG